MLKEFDAAVAEVVAAKGLVAGTLRINTLGMAARTLIAPRLGRFHHNNPDVVLDIVIDDGLSDIVAGRFDAGIRIGERLEKDMIAVRLTPDVPMMAVASPTYLARHGEPKTPNDLQHHACINWRFPGSGNLFRWPFEKKRRKLELTVGGPLIANLSDVAVEGALQGLGISTPTMMSSSLMRSNGVGCDACLPTGHRPCPECSGTRNRSHSQPALRAFIDCLLDRDLTGS